MIQKFFFFLFCVLSFLLNFSVSAKEVTPYTAYIKEGTILHRLKDKKDVVVSKGIYAKILESDSSKRDSFYVYDKNGIAQYEMGPEGLVEIADDIALLPKVDAEKIYPPQSVFKAEDKFAAFNTTFAVHFDNLQVSQLNDIYNDHISTVFATRYEVSTFYETELPYKFGFNFNYESAYWKNDVEDVKLSILSMGPYFKYHFFNEESFNAFVVLGGEVAPIYSGTTTHYSDKYSATLYDFGLESEWLSPIGTLSIGSHFRHHEVALKQNNRANQQTPKEFTLNSFGVMIGYKIMWDL